MGTEVLASLKDIAKATGYSLSTVSRVMRSKGEISEAARKRIHEAAERLGYHENRLISGFQTGRSRLIGVICDHSNPFFQKIETEIQKLLYQRDYMIISCASFNGTQQEDSALLRRLLEQRVDGIVIVPRDDFADNDYFRDFVSRRIPVISVDRKTKADIDFVGTDDFYGGYLSARHLYETGRRNLGYLAGPDYASPARLRREGVEAFCREHPAMNVRIIDRFASIHFPKELVLDFLRTHPETDSFATFFDWQAILLCRYLFEEKIRIPDDIAVMGFGCMEPDYANVFPVTSVDQKTETIAEKIVERLFLRLEHGREEHIPSAEIRIKPEIVVKGSTVKQEKGCSLRIGSHPSRRPSKSSIKS